MARQYNTRMATFAYLPYFSISLGARGLGPKARKLPVAATLSNDNLDSVPHCHSVVPNQTVI